MDGFGVPVWMVIGDVGLDGFRGVGLGGYWRCGIRSIVRFREALCVMCVTMLIISISPTVFRLLRLLRLATE